MTLVQSYGQEFPGLEEFFGDVLETYFRADPRVHPEVAHRLEEFLDHLGEGVVRKALVEWSGLGLLAGGERSDRQVEAFWQSPLSKFLTATVGYAPGPGEDVMAALGPPLAAAAELEQRRRVAAEMVSRGALATGGQKYWQVSLKLVAPELYLLPFLAAHQPPWHGIDLGCGWGRGAFPLLRSDQFHLTGVDLGREAFGLLEKSPARSLELVVSPCTSLPFEADVFDFGQALVLFDLLSDQALDQCLSEVLRCLKPLSPFYVEVPTTSFCMRIMQQQFSDRGLIDRFHSCRAHGKTFQLVRHETLVRGMFTFAVAPVELFSDKPRTRHRRSLERSKVLPLMTGEMNRTEAEGP